MPLHDSVGINCKKGATTEYHSQMSSICYKGCMLIIVRELSDMTTPLWWREKVMVYYLYVLSELSSVILRIFSSVILSIFSSLILRIFSSCIMIDYVILGFLTEI